MMAMGNRVAGGGDGAADGDGGDGAAGGGDGAAGDSGPHPAEAAVLAAPPEGLEEEAVGPEGGNAFEAGEDSDIGPADEDEAEEPEAAGDVIVDAHHFPMVGFRFTFLDLVYSLLHLVHYNNHILVRPRPLQLNVPPAPPAATAAHEAQGSSSSSSSSEATWETAEEPDKEEPAATEGEGDPRVPGAGAVGGCGRPGTEAEVGGAPRLKAEGPGGGPVP